MEPVYSQNFQIQDIHLDRFGRVKPSMLLYFTQEVSAGHCNELALSWRELAQKGLFWAVLRHRVSVTRLPQAGETVTVQTWPMPTTRVAYPRAVCAYDAQGNELFRAASLWVLMDADSRAMVLPGKSGVEVPGITRGSELALPGSLNPKELSGMVRRQVCYTELDRNGHMNNTRYLDWGEDLLPSDFHRDHPVRDFTVCYLSEAREGQTADIAFHLDENGVLQADGHRQRTDVDSTKERIFTARVQY